MFDEPLNHKCLIELRRKIIGIVRTKTLKPEEIPQLKRMLVHLQKDCKHPRVISAHSVLISAGGHTKKQRFCLSCGLKEVSTGSFKILKNTTIKNFPDCQKCILTHPLVPENWQNPTS